MMQQLLGQSPTLQTQLNAGSDRMAMDRIQAQLGQGQAQGNMQCMQTGVAVKTEPQARMHQGQAISMHQQRMGQGVMVQGHANMIQRPGGASQGQQQPPHMGHAYMNGGTSHIVNGKIPHGRDSGAVQGMNGGGVPHHGNGGTPGHVTSLFSNQGPATTGQLRSNNGSISEDTSPMQDSPPRVSPGKYQDCTCNKHRLSRLLALWRCMLNWRKPGLLGLLQQNRVRHHNCNAHCCEVYSIQQPWQQAGNCKLLNFLHRFRLTAPCSIFNLVLAGCTSRSAACVRDATPCRMHVCMPGVMHARVIALGHHSPCTTLYVCCHVF